MDRLTFVVIWVAALLVGLRVLGIALALRVVLRVRLNRGRHTIIQREEIPQALHDAWEGPSAELMAAGLEPEGYARLPGEGSEIPVRVFRAPDGGTRAILFFGVAGDDAGLCCGFHSWLVTGKAVVTMNARSAFNIGTTPDRVVDPLTPSPTEQYRAHCQALAEEGAAVEVETLATCLTRMDERRSQHLDELAAAGHLEPASEGGYQLTLREAFALIRRVLRAQKVQAGYARRQAEWRRSRPQEAAPLEEEVRLYQDHQLISRRGGRRERTGWLLLISVAAFVASQLPWLPISTVIILMAVLLLHELGHLLAMRAFGQFDARILFIPFLGAVATTRARPVAPEQQVIILLAGPVPGLLLGLGLLQWPAFLDLPHAATTVGMLLVINLFNLLPIYPLDGGQILHTLATAGRPRLDLALKAVTASLVVAGGIFLSSGVLATLGALVLLSLGYDRRRLSIERAARARMAADPAAASDHTAAVWQVLRSWPDRLGFSQKATLAEQVIPRLAHGGIRASAGLAWLALYGIVLLGGGGSAAVLTVERVGQRSRAAAEPPRDRAAALPASCTGDGRLLWPARLTSAIQGEAEQKVVVVWCAHEDPTAIAAFTHELVDRRLAEGSCMSFDGAGDPEKERALRRAHARHVIEDRYDRLGLEARELPGPALAEELRRETAGDPEVDEETLVAFATMNGHQELGQPDEGAARRLAAGVLFGERGARTCDRPLGLYGTEVAGKEASSLLFFTPESDLAGLGRWLCARGCRVAVSPVEAPRGMTP
jgi:Zn-dependent protease